MKTPTSIRLAAVFCSVLALGVASAGEANTPPVLAPIGNKTACGPGSTLTFTATATDADIPADALTFSLDAGAPPGATINAATGAFSWTPFAFGSFAVTVRVTDNGTPAMSDFEIIAITVTAVPNQPPVLGAIGDKTVNELEPLTFTATATDAFTCGDPQLLTFSLDAGAPPGATINGSSGAFSWTPTEAQGPGSYPITIRVTDNGSPALSDFETIIVTVLGANGGPTAAAGGPYTGTTNVPVNFDGSGSSDPDGDALTFSWTLGDGATGSGVMPMHTYAAAGLYDVTLRVTDPGGLFDDDATTATIQDVAPADVFYRLGLNYIFPQILPTWIRIEPIDASFNINDVLLSTVSMTYNGMTILAGCKNIVDGDTNHNGAREIRVCFAQKDLKTLFAALPNGTTTVVLTLTGGLLPSGTIRGDVTANVVKFSWLSAGSLASVSPNPLNPQAKLSFVVMNPGVTTIQVFDVNGRLVRTLMQRQYLEPGVHVVTIDGRNEQGSQLASGIYFYRVQSADGVSKGSIAILR